MKAIVITDDHYNGLGVIRSLGEEGIYNIVIILNKGETFIEKSKYINELYKINNYEEEIVEAINRVICDKDEYYLFPLSDYIASILDKYYTIFPENVVVPHLEGQMDKYLDKNFVKEIAYKNNLKVPNSVVIESDSLEEITWHTFPAILKPVKSIEGRKNDIVKVESYDDLVENIELLKIKGYNRILLEEFIYGNNEHMIEVMGFCNSKREPVICGIIEKIREYPIRNGSTSYAKIVDNHDGLDIEAVKSFLKDTNYFGLFDIEFKFANGNAYFIECNFRNGAPSYSLTYNNTNIPVMWVQNKTSIVSSELNNRYFMCEQYDVINMLKKNIGLFKWCNEFVHAKKILFIKEDIKPVFYYYYLATKNKLKGIISK